MTYMKPKIETLTAAEVVEIMGPAQALGSGLTHTAPGTNISPDSVMGQMSGVNSFGKR